MIENTSERMQDPAHQAGFLLDALAAHSDPVSHRDRITSEGVRPWVIVIGRTNQRGAEPSHHTRPRRAVRGA